MEQFRFTGEELHERSALLRDMVADRVRSIG